MSLRYVALCGLLCIVTQASAWVLTLTTGPRELYLMVGVGTPASNNTAVNTVSVVVPALSVGSGTALPMTSDSTQSASPFRSYAVCNPPAQVYVGGSYRAPNASVGAGRATLQVTTPASLTSGADSIPFSQIGWTSTANGDPTADIAAGTFSGGTQLLAELQRNRAMENCFTFTYANTVIAPAGTFTGRAVFTLMVP